MPELGSLLERDLDDVIAPASYGLNDVARRRNRLRRNRQLGTTIVVLLLLVVAGVVLSRAFDRVSQWVPASAPSGTVVFSQQGPEDGLAYLYTARTDGGDVSRLVPWSVDAFDISPDGTRVLVGNLDGDRVPWARPAIVGLDGSDLVTFTSGGPDLGMWPSDWSPDGSRFVAHGFDAADDSTDGIYTANTSDGQDVVQVTLSPGPVRDRVIGFGPDGTTILFMRPMKEVAGDSAAQALLVVNADGTGLAQLNPAETTLRVAPRQTSLSPDGRLAFVAAAGTPGESRAGPVRRAVFVVAADGSQPTRITPWGDVTSVAWSPDGGWIAFGRVDAGIEEVFLVRPDGSEVREVTSAGDGLSSSGPAWSPDGTWLLVTRSPDRARFNWTLWRVRPDGTGLVRLSSEPAEYLSYGWSPRERSSGA